MSERGGGEPRVVSLTRADLLGGAVRIAVASANDNRRRAERGAVLLGRAVAGAGGCSVRRPPASAAITAQPPAPTVPDPASAPTTSWLGQSLALWSASLGVACRLPPIASGLACWYAWSELGLSGVASCASVVARSAELASLAITRMLDAAPFRRRLSDPS